MKWFRRRGKTIAPMVAHNVRSITQLEEEYARRRSFLDRVSDHISQFAGSIGFILAHVVFFAAWMLGNVLLGPQAFDPYPYVFLNLVLAVEAVLLGTFVLMSQNRQNRQAEQRAHLDLQISLLAEQETTKTLQMLQRICERLGLNDAAQDKELKQMIQTTHVQLVADELQRAQNGKPATPVAASEPKA